MKRFLLLSLGLLLILHYRSAAYQGNVAFCIKISLGVELLPASAAVDLEPRGTLDVCPTSSDPVRLRCSVTVNSSNQQLFWTATDSSGTHPFVIFCNTQNPTTSGPYQLSASGQCPDDRLNSTLTFNVTEEANVTCTRLGGPMQSVFVKFRGL